MLFPPLPLWGRGWREGVKQNGAGWGVCTRGERPLTRLTSFGTLSHKGRGKRKKGRPKGRPFNTSAGRSMRAVRHGFRAVSPDIDADEQEQPHHVDGIPVPGREFEDEVLGP